VVTNPLLLEQFGPDPDLNHAIFTRYRLRKPPTVSPDAIMVMVSGFEGGAGDYKVLAENLIPRAFVTHGQVVELWAFDRRSQQLEDIAGLNTAEQTADAQVALNWLFGSELGLPLGALPRNAIFYNTSDDVPFIANWTPLMHSRDIDEVV